MEPRWIGIKGALATRSPSGANSAQEKSRRSLMLVLIEVCCNERPIASATLMKRLAKRVSRIGSGPLLGVFVLRLIHWWELLLNYAWSAVPEISEWSFESWRADRPLERFKIGLMYVVVVITVYNYEHRRIENPSLWFSFTRLCQP